MDPGVISRLVDQAKCCEEQQLDPLVVFALRWIAWEGLRIRTLVVATRLSGWRMEDAVSTIGKLRVSSNAGFAEGVKIVCNYNIDKQLRGDARGAWEATCEMEVLRHRFFHGYKHIQPQLLQPASEAVAKFIRNADMVFGGIEVPGPDGTIRLLGDPLRRKPATGLGIPITRQVGELERLFTAKKKKLFKKRLPSQSEAEGWLTIFADV